MEFLLPGLIRDVSMTPWKNSSDHFCHSTQVLVMWSADPSLRVGVRKPQFGACSFCFLCLTAVNNTFLWAYPGECWSSLFVCEVLHGYCFSECYSLIFSRSSFLKSLQYPSCSSQNDNPDAP